MSGEVTIRHEPLPWQKEQWERLVDRLRSGRLPHALLLTGVPGLGKRQFARAFAMAALCESPSETGIACGTCRSCTLAAAGSHPDFLEIGMEEGKRIAVGQIRELSSRLGLHAQYGEHRAVVIDPADQMNTNAANALLKTLEEPAPGTILLLVSDRPSALLATIRSRCQVVAFRPPPPADTRDWVAQNVAGEQDPELLLALAGGAPRSAVALAEGALEERGRILDELEAVLQGRADPVAVAERWFKEDAKAVLEWVYSLAADMVRLQQGGEPRLNHPDLAPRLQRLADPVDLTHLFRLQDRVTQAGRLLQGQANPQLLLEELLIVWSRPPRA